jgi:hypothetical protein
MRKFGLTKIPWEWPDSQAITVAALGSTVASVVGQPARATRLSLMCGSLAYNEKTAGSDRPHHLARARKTCLNVEKRQSSRVQEPS